MRGSSRGWGWAATALILLLVQAGCLITTTTREHGTPVAIAEIEKIQPGTTTKADVIKLLGDPSEQRKTVEEETFIYRYKRESNATVLFLLHSETQREAALTVTFGPDGIVRQVVRK